MLRWIRASRARPGAHGAIELALLLAWFCNWSRRGWDASFVADDMMNIWSHVHTQGWPRAMFSIFDLWTPLQRPAGALFYVPLYSAFGFNARPFHGALLLLLATNAAVSYFVIRRVAGRKAALPGMALIVFLPMFADIYYGLHTVYDTLCSLFTWSAFLVHISVRCPGVPSKLLRLGGTTLLFGLALASKEMALALPLFLFLHELLIAKPTNRRFDWMIPIIPLAAASVWFRVLSAPAQREAAGYGLDISWNSFISHWGHYLRWLTEFHYREVTPVLTASILLLPLTCAIALRSRAAVFGWLVFITGALPVIFAATRNVYVLFVPLLGLGMVAGAFASELGRRWHVPAALFAIPFGCWAAYATMTTGDRYVGWIERDSAPLRQTFQYLDKQKLQLPRGARVLSERDPFPFDDYALQMTLGLYYRDPALKVDRLKFGKLRPDIRYDAILRIE